MKVGPGAGRRVTVGDKVAVSVELGVARAVAEGTRDAVGLGFRLLVSVAEDEAEGSGVEVTEKGGLLQAATRPTVVVKRVRKKPRREMDFILPPLRRAEQAR